MKTFFFLPVRIIFILIFTWTVAMAYRMPDTNQNECFDDGEVMNSCDNSGQDGSFLINPLSYTKLDENGNELMEYAAEWAAVRDNVTGLIWEAKTDENKGNTYSSDTSIADFIDTLNSNSYGGQTEWRLPTVQELAELGTNMSDTSGLAKISPTFFPRTQTEGGFWGAEYSSSTTTFEGYTLPFVFKDYSIGFGTGDQYLRAVCGSESPGAKRFKKNGNNTVTDTSTGLMWELEAADKYLIKPGEEGYDPEQPADEAGYERTKALSYCNDLELAEFTDWRLPTVKEIMSIGDFKSPNPDTIIYSEIFETLKIAYIKKTNPVRACYLTSTYLKTADTTGPPAQAGINVPICMSFEKGSAGIMTGGAAGNVYFALAVRGGQLIKADNFVITEPKQGSFVEAGTTKTITWDNPESEIPGDVQILLSTDGGKNFNPLTEITENDGIFDWVVPFDLFSVNCVIEITPLENAHQNRGTWMGFFETGTSLGINLGSPVTQTAEDGTTTSVPVSLYSEPDGDVIIDFSSDNTDEGIVASGGRLTFTGGDYDTPQLVTVAGVDDDIADGVVLYHIVATINMALSTDKTGYLNIPKAQVALSNIDNDTAEIIINKNSISTIENGGTDTFTVKLNSEPTAKVTLKLTTNDEDECSIDKMELTFDTGDWNSPKTVVVTGKPDNKPGGDVPYSILIQIDKTDTLDQSGYKDLSSVKIDATNINVDPGMRKTDYITGFPHCHKISEEGGTSKFSLKLMLPPDNDVVIDIISRDTTEGVTFPEKLTFTKENWEVEQMVTISGVDDFEVDGLQEFEIDITVNTSETQDTTGYKNAPPVVIQKIRNSDDNDWESIGFTVSEVSGEINEEGGSATFKIKLNTVPDGDVIINITSLDETEGTISPSSLIFTPSIWNIDQTLTVTGVDDNEEDGEKDFIVDVEVSSATTDTTGYEGVSKTQLTLTNKEIPTNAGDSRGSGGDSSGSCFIGSVK